MTAAVGLHTTVGPAHTTDAAIARKAGVTRVTYYRHFPDAVSLFRACSAHGLEAWPPPDPQPWLQIKDPRERLTTGLMELYEYYRMAGPGLVVIGRDVPLLDPKLSGSPSRLDVIRAISRVLAGGWHARGRRERVIGAAVNHAVNVNTWQSLVRQQSLDETEAVQLLVAMVMAAADGQAFGAVLPSTFAVS